MPSRRSVFALDEPIEPGAAPPGISRKTRRHSLPRPASLTARESKRRSRTYAARSPRSEIAATNIVGGMLRKHNGRDSIPDAAASAGVKNGRFT